MLDPSDGVFGRFDLAALCGCHTLNVCCCCCFDYHSFCNSCTTLPTITSRYKVCPYLLHSMAITEWELQSKSPDVQRHAASHQFCEEGQKLQIVDIQDVTTSHNKRTKNIVASIALATSVQSPACRQQQVTSCSVWQIHSCCIYKHRSHTYCTHPFQCYLVIVCAEIS